MEYVQSMYLSISGTLHFNLSPGLDADHKLRITAQF